MEFKTIFNNIVKYVTAEVDPSFKKWILSFSFYRPLIDEIKAMKGAQWNPETKTWSIDICKRNIFAFKVLANAPQYRHYLEDPISTLIDTQKYENLFYKHQLEMYKIIMHHKRCELAACMRSGKTLPTLMSFMDSNLNKCFWICTKTATLGVERELNKWFPEFKEIENNHYIGNNREIYFFTYEKFVSLIEICKKNECLNSLPQFIVFDECHKLKTPHTQRSIAALIVSEEVENIYSGTEYIISLSGTPAPKDPSDWWTQCEVTRSGFIREGDINKFRKRYGIYTEYNPNDPVPAWERFQGWDKDQIFKLAKRLKGLVFVFNQDVLDLPDKRYVIIRLKPSEELLRVAKMITEVEDNVLKARMRLRQISDGFEYEKTYDKELNTMIKTCKFIGSPKIDRLKHDLTENEDFGRLVVYAGFQGSIDIIKETCLSAGWWVLQIDGRGQFLHKVLESTHETSKVKDDIMLAMSEMDRSTNKYNILKLVVVAEPQSMAGIEFSAAHINIYYSNDDSGEGRMQSESRSYSRNMDREKGLTIIDYILLPTDELIRNKLFEKRNLQNLSMGQLKEALNEVYRSGSDSSGVEIEYFNPEEKNDLCTMW